MHLHTFFFLAAAQLADLVVVVTQIQTDQLLLPTVVNQLQGWQWRAWKLMYCSLEWNRAKQLGSSNIKWKQSGVKENPSVPNSYSLISTAVTHKALQKFLKMRRWNILRGRYSGCLQHNVAPLPPVQHVTQMMGNASQVCISSGTSAQQLIAVQNRTCWFSDLFLHEAGEGESRNGIW